jgi:hypothetical protein
MTEKIEKRKPFFANINEDEFDLLTRFEGKYLIRVRAFSAMNLYMTYTHKQLAIEWGCDERTVRIARVGLIKKGFCALVEDGKRQYLTPTYSGGCGSFRSGQEDKTGSKRSADRNDPDQSDPQRGSFRSASADQNDPTALYIKKECIKRNVLRENKEGLTPQSFASLTPRPSASCVSEFSSAILIPSEVQKQLINPAFVSESTALEALVDQLVAKKLAEASRSLATTRGHSDTSVGMVQGQEGGKMEPVGASAPTISKPKSSKPKKAKSYTEYAEHDFFWPEHWGRRGRQALQTWVEYKRDTGKAVLLQSYQQLIKNFIGDEPGFILAVDHSIANAYQGLFKPDARQLKNTPQVKSKEDKDKAVSAWYERIQNALEMKD